MDTMQVPKGVYLDSSMNLFYPQGAKMTDGFPEDLRPVLHPHWETFPPQNPLILYCFGIFLMTLSVICIVINSLVFYVFVTAKSLRTPVSIWYSTNQIHWDKKLGTYLHTILVHFSVKYFHGEFSFI